MWEAGSGRQGPGMRERETGSREGETEIGLAIECVVE